MAIGYVIFTGFPVMRAPISLTQSNASLTYYYPCRPSDRFVSFPSAANGMRAVPSAFPARPSVCPSRSLSRLFFDGYEYEMGKAALLNVAISACPDLAAIPFLVGACKSCY